MAVVQEGFETGPDGLGITNVNTNLDAISEYFDPYMPEWSYAMFTTTSPHSGLLCATAKPLSSEQLNHPYTPRLVGTQAVDDYWWMRRVTANPTGANVPVYRLWAAPPTAHLTNDFSWQALEIRVFNDDWFLQVHPNFSGTGSSVDYFFTMPESAWVKFRLQIALNGDASMTVTDGTGTVLLNWSHAGFLSAPTVPSGPQSFAYHAWWVYNDARFQSWLDDINFETVSPGAWTVG